MPTKTIPKQKIAALSLPDKGWVAGILDFQGRLNFKNNKLRNTPQVTIVVQTRFEEIGKRLGELTGTTPEMIAGRPIRDFMRRNCDEHCPLPHVHVHPYAKDDAALPPQIKWSMSGAGIAVMLENILPYLYTTRINWAALHQQMIDQAVLFGQGASAVHAQIRRLYFCGWTLPNEFLSVLE